MRASVQVLQVAIVLELGRIGDGDQDTSRLLGQDDDSKTDGYLWCGMGYSYGVKWSPERQSLRTRIR